MAFPITLLGLALDALRRLTARRDALDPADCDPGGDGGSGAPESDTSADASDDGDGAGDGGDGAGDGGGGSGK
ncbi:hypothetical protein [Roseomonas chloroacetimidivorans]|jgi:hypothetical protein|uniref:hypothetical protein n=1 Tax=Roseomonas chloroacetimidivorans TaxID=1766656 RepID=UPI003C741408